MIIGIGNDIVEHKVTRSLKWATDLSVQNRIFSKSELDIYFSSRDIRFLSGRYAVKEAVVKCLGTGMIDGISMADIQVLRTEDGAPILKLIGQVSQLSDAMGINSWHVSITHSSQFSVAFVIAEKRPNDNL